MKKNTTKKKITAKYSVNVVNVKDDTDVYAALAFSKIKKELIDTNKMSDLEFNAMCETIGNEAVKLAIEEIARHEKNICMVYSTINEMVNSMLMELIETPKLPWYKRFWNWITRKK